MFFFVIKQGVRRKYYRRFVPIGRIWIGARSLHPRQRRQGSWSPERKWRKTTCPYSSRLSERSPWTEKAGLPEKLSFFAVSEGYPDCISSQHHTIPRVPGIVANYRRLSLHTKTAPLERMDSLVAKGITYKFSNFCLGTSNPRKSSCAKEKLSL